MSIRDQIITAMNNIDKPVTPQEIYDKSQMRHRPDAIECALRSLQRSGLVQYSRHDGTWQLTSASSWIKPQEPVAKKIKVKNVPPKISESDEEKLMKALENEMFPEKIPASLGIKLNDLAKSLDKAEIAKKIKGLEIKDINLKVAVLEKLEVLLDPEIGAVLNSIKSDINRISSVNL